MKTNILWSILLMLFTTFALSSCQKEEEDPSLWVTPEQLIYDYQGKGVYYEIFNYCCPLKLRQLKVIV